MKWNAPAICHMPRRPRCRVSPDLASVRATWRAVVASSQATWRTSQPPGYAPSERRGVWPGEGVKAFPFAQVAGAFGSKAPVTPQIRQKGWDDVQDGQGEEHRRAAGQRAGFSPGHTRTENRRRSCRPSTSGGGTGRRGRSRRSAPADPGRPAAAGPEGDEQEGAAPPGASTARCRRHRPTKEAGAGEHAPGHQHSHAARRDRNRDHAAPPPAGFGKGWASSRRLALLERVTAAPAPGNGGPRVVVRPELSDVRLGGGVSPVAP